MRISAKQRHQTTTTPLAVLPAYAWSSKPYITGGCWRRRKRRGTYGYRLRNERRRSSDPVEDGEASEVEKQGTCMMLYSSSLPDWFGIPAGSRSRSERRGLAGRRRPSAGLRASSWSELMHVPSFSIVHASPAHLVGLVAVHVQKARCV
ncbi:hypothetical protein EJB05_36004, partial [Eragrostis curvula]